MIRVDARRDEGCKFTPAQHGVVPFDDAEAIYPLPVESAARCQNAQRARIFHHERGPIHHFGQTKHVLVGQQFGNLGRPNRTPRRLQPGR